MVDAIEPANLAQVDDAIGGVEPLLEPVHEVDPPRLGDRGRTEESESLLEGGGVVPHEARHL